MHIMRYVRIHILLASTTAAPPIPVRPPLHTAPHILAYTCCIGRKYQSYISVAQSVAQSMAQSIAQSVAPSVAQFVAQSVAQSVA
ncbi:hypothetical protein BDZ91DRAFT_150564 [Kalaharituber pfeilii]|nr:hypothetical protein BDZ91DRAFT_150564 [Kalaharituber pfeilii]